MGPKIHLVQAVVGAAAVFPFLGGTDAAVFGLTVFFIDLDHIPPFLRDCKSLSVREFFRYHDRVKATPNFLSLNVLHTAEFFLALFALGYWRGIFWVMLGACLFHIALDVANGIRMGRPFLRAYSVVEYLARRSGKTTRLPSPNRD